MSESDFQGENRKKTFLGKTETSLGKNFEACINLPLLKAGHRVRGLSLRVQHR